MSEPLASRLRRRALTVPSVLGATVVAVAAAPLIATILIASDLLRGRLWLPRLRTYLFACQYLVNDSVEIVLAPLYWVMAGFGTRLESSASLARHRRLQWWSLDLLATRADQLLGLPVEIGAASRTALGPGPVVVVSRHASLFDASLPGLVYGREGFAVRGVIMAELLADPGFDLLYGRLGSIFIPRDDGPVALAAIHEMARSIRRHDGEAVAVVIFPEGRLFGSAARDRALARLTAGDPERAERLAGLQNLLPPRPGGLRVLLDAIPEADVVLLDHRGLDGLAGLADLTDVAPLAEPVTVTARRIARSEIPDEPAAFAEWLDGLWLDLDAELIGVRGDDGDAIEGADPKSVRSRSRRAGAPRRPPPP